MNDFECENTFDQLQKTMERAGLSWVTTQVNEELRFGRLLTKRVTSRAELSEDLILRNVYAAKALEGRGVRNAPVYPFREVAFANLST